MIGDFLFVEWGLDVVHSTLRFVKSVHLRLRSFLQLALIAACAYQPLLAGQRWISVTTPHFEMYTTNNEKQAIQALQVFEQVRYFFLQNSKGKQAPEDRVRIIAFSSEKEYKPYRLNGGSFAYYVQSRERDYIVMQDIQADHHQAAVHEYTHLIVQHMKLELPIWLNEGMADLYSSLEPHGSQAMVGRPLSGRLPALLQQRWMDWNLLFAVDHESPYYNESEKMSIFYAQSWALTHMLALSPPYMRNFSKFVAAVGSGMPTSIALEKVYGKSVAQAGNDVQSYLRQSSIKAAVFDVTLAKSNLEPQVTDLSDFQVRLALADLLATRRDSIAEAQRRLNALEGQYPQSPETQESLGYLALQQNNLPDTRNHFALAVQRGSKDARMMLDYAELAHSEGPSSPTMSPQKIVELVETAISLAPDNIDAKILLGQLESEQHHYSAALTALSQVHIVSPDQAFPLFFLTAYCRESLHDTAAAKEFAGKAAPYAQTPSQHAQLEIFLQYLKRSERPETAPVTETQLAKATHDDDSSFSKQSIQTTLKRDVDLPHVEGRTKAFECGKGTYKLHVQVGNRELVFGMDHPQDVIIRGKSSLEWSCGPLDTQTLTVIFQPSRDSKLDGLVAELVF